MSSAARDQQVAIARQGSYGSHVAGQGWVGFAAIMLAFAGVWNTINGLLAIGSSRVYVADAEFVFSDLQTWGWIMLILGVLQLVASVAVAGGAEWARWFGIGVAALNAFGQLYFIDAKPLWAMAIFAVDLLIIYGLAAHGGRQLRDV